MRLLFIAPRHDPLTPFPELAEEQIMAGPDWLDQRLGQHVVSLAAPANQLIISQLLLRLPTEQAPDALVCLADTRRLQLPRDIAAFPGPKVLLLANLEATRKTSTGLLDYLKQEQFDRVVVVDDLRACQHLREAGIAADWFPGLTLPTLDHISTDEAVMPPNESVAIVGDDEATLHLATAAITALRRANIALEIVSRDEVGKTGAQLAIHFSPNTHFDLVPWQLLAEGTLPLVAQPPAGVGWTEVLPHGAHWFGFSDLEEMVEAIHYLQEQPETVEACRQRNQAWFGRHLRPTARREALRHYIETGTVPEVFAGALTASLTASADAFNAPPKPTLPAMVRQAVGRLDHGDHAQALQFATTALQENPLSVDALLVVAEIAFEAGNRVKWEEACTTLNLLAPDNPRMTALQTWHPTWGRTRFARRTIRNAWQAAWTGHLDEFVNLARRATKLEPRDGRAHHALGMARQEQRNLSEANQCLDQAVQWAPEEAILWWDRGVLQRTHRQHAAAIASFARAAELSPSWSLPLLAQAEAAIDDRDWQQARRTIIRLRRNHPENETAQAWEKRLPPAPAGESHPEVNVSPANERPRDLLICGSEMDRGHGTGVLMQRAYPESSDFVVLRSQTLYGGSEVFGGSHLVVSGEGRTDAELRRELRMRLASFNIRRILCVPFGPLDFRNAILTRQLRQVPLATYVMDDQAAYSDAVDDQLATDLFAASDLRLAISPEMADTYEQRFGSPFAIMPPLVSQPGGEVINRWTPKMRRANHAIMVGNVWSLAQFARLRALVKATGLKIDWFGNPKLVLSHFDEDQLSAEGIHCRGFIPESDLARALAEYPFTLVLSGTLDGTENNEWLSRLSLPSRMVFILTKTRTPMLVLGSPDTCAARFATGLGIGLTAPYEVTPLQRAINRLGNEHHRSDLIDRAHAVASSFIMPDAGKWIWESLAKGSAKPAPFLEVFASAKKPPMPPNKPTTSPATEMTGRLVGTTLA